MGLDTIVKISNKYGSDPEMVLAGGGNTSYKTDGVLYIKASGTSLATITADGFAGLDRSALAKIRESEYPEESDVREAQVLADLMAARLPGSENKRPSVETLLHDLFEEKYVLHVHPAIINGLTCSVGGKEFAAAAFPDALWVDETEPGYVLASLCLKERDNYHAKRGVFPKVIILQNHGIFFAADTEAEIDALVCDYIGKVRSAITEQPDFTEIDTTRAEAAKIAPALRMLYDSEGRAAVKFAANAQVMKYAESREAFAPLLRPLTPDHIVYCKAEPLFVDGASVECLRAAFAEFESRRKFKPRVVFVKDVGMFTLGCDNKSVDISQAVWFDAMKIAVYAKSFGGVRHMSPSLEDFIVNWEVESYRAKVSASAGAGKMSGKIVIVTGSAQGFGRGIAESFANESASVVIADMNASGAQAVADELNSTDSRRAISCAVNVSDEQSVAAMIERTVLEFGGLDILVNNAGIVRAGSLEEMTKANFELVASVNYTAYFLCVKYAVAPMKLQRVIAPDYMSDIVEINSKSGLSGSNKNFAYAGSKFGGIGLTQSFAMELAPYGIKVNAVCPGNFLDGPLWSDPVKGLFVQYLNAGKVPGAKTVDDVRAYYESKVPLGRGCRTEDVVLAIFYIIAQKYETGQAVPVTGGQQMLK